MLTGKVLSLALLSGEIININAPLPRGFGIPEVLVVVGVFWADGVDLEPPRWEVLVMPATFAMLTAEHDPELVQRAVKTLLGLVNLRAQKDPTREAINAVLAEGHKGLSAEESQNLRALLETLNEARTKVSNEGSLGVVVFVPDHQVRHVVREAPLDAVIDLLLRRRIEEERTRLEVEEEEEVPEEGGQPEGAAGG